MKVVELYAQVRYAVRIEGLSRREAARRFGIDPRTVAKMLAFSVPPGYRRSKPPRPSILFAPVGRFGEKPDGHFSFLSSRVGKGWNNVVEIRRPTPAVWNENTFRIS